MRRLQGQVVRKRVSHLLLARDLKRIKPNDYVGLNQRATELKRMLTAPMHKLNADG